MPMKLDFLLNLTVLVYDCRLSGGFLVHFQRQFPFLNRGLVTIIGRLGKATYMPILKSLSSPVAKTSQASAAVAVDSSHMTASSSALCRFGRSVHLQFLS